MNHLKIVRGASTPRSKDSERDAPTPCSTTPRSSRWKMETERSPIGRTQVPRYTFLGDGSLPKEKCGRWQCFCLATVIVMLAVALVTLLAYFLTGSYASVTTGNGTELLDGLSSLEWPLRGENYTNEIGDIRTELLALEYGTQGLRNKDTIEDILPRMDADSPEFRHQLSVYTTKKAQEMSRLGFALDRASKKYNKWRNRTKTPTRWIVPEAPEWLPVQNETVGCLTTPYRTASGHCNNLQNPTWGTAFTKFRRILLPRYDDGISEPRKATDGSSLPSAREVSLTIHRPNFQTDVNFTVMLAVWGQFIDHDITATAISKARDGSPIRCCQTPQEHPECFPIVLSTTDPIYLRSGISCMEFVRSAPAPSQTLGPREQFNQVSSYLDGSVIYGSEESVMNELRSFTGGRLKMLETPEGSLLPVSNNVSDGCNRREEFEKGRYCFLSGDARSNENLLLTSMHLLFARQHNLIADELSRINPHWRDETIFQETRKIVGAQIQHITYNEFLPSLLPESLMRHLNLSERISRGLDHYNSSVDPTIANVFASAAFRFGHTLLPGLMQFLRENGTRREYVELHKMLFNPFKLFEKGFLEDFVRSVANASAGRSDVHVTRQLTEKLFQRDTNNPCGLDLVAMNIQRGRDHGIPSYPNWRKVCGLRTPREFDDLRYDVDEDTLGKLKTLYRSVDDLDLYTGGLAEKPVRGGLLGPTMTCLIADQFLRLKIGDRYWYDRVEGSQRFTRDQLKQIRKSTLSKIICKTSTVTEAQAHVMRRPEPNNKIQPCDILSYPDFEPWRQ